MLHFCNQQYG
uniref:Uncharacterized protein n=1 Tax=Lepeophtheirus salmonis TaxID=72036 RepID=A0A0K2UWJ3_LEPSM